MTAPFRRSRAEQELNITLNHVTPNSVTIGRVPRPAALIPGPSLWDTASDDSESTRDMTIDELARRAGTTTRNVRALQSSGVSLPPAIRGRTAHYDLEHLDRLEAVIRLQSSGFSLASIRALFEALSEGRTLLEVLGLTPRAHAPADGVRPPRLFSILPTTVLDEVV